MIRRYLTSATVVPTVAHDLGVHAVSRFWILIQVFFIVLIAAPSLAFSQTQPRPPARLCIDDVDGCDTPPPTLSGIKWHPGNYLKAAEGGNTSQLSRTLDSNNILGADILYFWGSLESAEGIYDFSDIVTDLNWLKSRNKRLIVQLMDRKFGTTISTGIVPSYLSTHLYKTKDGYGLAIWRPAVMDRYIALVTSICKQFDADSHFEMLRAPSEISPGQTIDLLPADYSREALATQMKRIYDAALKACPRTIAVASINSLSGQEEGLISYAYRIPLGFATPDAFDDLGHRIFRGENTTGFDYRGRLAHYTIASSPVLGGKDNNGPATNVLRWAQENRVTHLSWISYATTSGNTWADILAAIGTGQLSTSCPTAYDGRCDSK